MSHRNHPPFRRPPASRLSLGRIALGVLALLAPGAALQAGNLTRGGLSTSPGGAGASTSQTSTSATAATAQITQAAVLAQRAQISMQRSLLALQAIQAKQNAQSAARNLALLAPSTVPNGLVIGGLVPDSGLASPGVANPVTTWVNAKAPTQSSSNGQTTVTVVQTAQQALLNWQSFNIGKNTTLDFDQSAGGANVGQWVAINEVAANIAPSQVLGSIQAPGQVYVINQNGIIFGGSSQVNVHALVASSLPINTNLVNQGLLTGATTDDQFLFSQLTVRALTGVTGPTPTFIPPAAPTGGDGDVVVQAGAQLTSPTTQEHVGGRIALIGPVVDNEGAISTPDGQTVLAAGLQVGFAAHSQDDPSLRGLDVYVGKVTDPSYNGRALANANGVALGTAINGGIIDIDRADITMAGAQVAQNGIIDGSTSVALNGRVDLLADFNAQVLNFNGALSISPTATGAVTFGAGSLTQILPELSSTDTVVGASLALPSLVNVQGQSIYMGSGALLLAPGANVPATNPALDLAQTPLTSGVTFNAGNWNLSSNLYYFLNDSGQVYLDTGAVIDASGSSGVSASVDENIIAVQLRGTELADSPLQQNGPLRGQTVDVDIRQTGVYDGQAWVGTPLADASGYVGLIQHTVGELTVNGGTVAINAGDSVVMQKGSDIDVSGGYINYQAGEVQTTQVVSGGIVYDISQATPDRVYSGIYTGFSATSAKWGVSQSYSNSLQNGQHEEAGYIQGGNGGSLSIIAPAMALDGQLLGTTLAGPHQRTPAGQLNATFAGATFPGTDFVSSLLPILSVPKSSSLSLTFSQNENLNDEFLLPTTSPDVMFVTQAYLAQNPPAAVPAFGFDASGNPLPLPAARQGLVLLSQDLVNADGFANFSVDTSPSGAITLPAGVDLAAAPGGALSFRAINIDLEAGVSAPGGSLRFTTYDSDPYAPRTGTPPPDFTQGNFTLGNGATLSAAGLIVDDRALSPTADTLPQEIAGGSVTINSFSANLESGTAITASGGVSASSSGKLTYGKGGTITIEAGTDPSTAGLPGSGLPIIGGTLTLGAGYLSGQSLQAYSGTTGGGLVIQAPLIQVGGTLVTPSPLINIASTGDTTEIVAADPLLLSPGFFDQGGFASFTLTGLGAESAPGGVPDGSYLPAVVIAANTTIHPIVEGYLPVFNPGGISLTPMTLRQAASLLPSQRSAPSLTFNVHDIGGADANGFLSIHRLRADVVLESGASIVMDPNLNAGVSITGDTATVLGSIIVPGGTISVTGSANPGNYYLQPGEATVDLGSASLLSTQGQTELTQNNFGYRTGAVLNGGTITVSGNIVAETGAQLDVSGWRDNVEVAPGYVGGVANSLSSPAMVPATEDSNGGTITLNGGEELLNDATLSGFAGGTAAATTASGLTVGKSTAQGGALQISSGTVNSAAGLATPADPTLFVSQSAGDLPGLSRPVIGAWLLDAGQNALTNGGGYVAAGPLNAGGFGAMTLGGVVQFSGTVNLAAGRSLTVGSGGFIYGTDDAQGHPASINLTAPYVALGTAFSTAVLAQQNRQNGFVFTFESSAFYQPPVSGDAVLTINASTLTDIGNLSLQGIGTLNFNGASTASGFVPSTQAGDIRGDGTLDVAGTINLNARQIYPPTETTFTIAAYDANGVSGAVNIYAPTGETLPSVPLSAGGTLNVYASVINQAGVLRAPIGTINLGWDGAGSSPVNLLSNIAVNPTQTLNLASGGTTSVSAAGVVIPYGSINASGNWIDPAGNDITAGGSASLPAKQINISGMTLAADPGAVIDISGGGDLYANQFVSGTGGTNNILASTSNFAVIPGYSADYAYAPFDAVSTYAVTAYSHLSVGDQVALSAGNGLAAGTYTLLPAGYALLPGASLVTPEAGVPGSFATQPDGSSLVSGQRSSALDATGEQALNGAFAIAPQTVINARAEYDGSRANAYFPASAQANNVSVPRLPVDAGQVILNATEGLTLPNIPGTLLSTAGPGGLGGEVDIASPAAINIYNSKNAQTFVSGDLNLDAATLDSFGADSLLIGGYRQTGAKGVFVTVVTGDLTVDNAGAALTGPDIILASNATLTVGQNAEIGAGTESSGAAIPAAQTLSLAGDGTLLRVSSDPSARIIRSGVHAATGPDPSSLVIDSGAAILGAKVSGATSATAGSVILDSTNLTSLDPGAIVSANTLSINTGMVTIELPTLAAPITTPISGMVLSGASLSTLQQAVQNLSILSYSTLDIWGVGTIGAAPVAGQFAVQNLALHAAEFRGFDNGGETVTINAQNVSLGGVSNGTAPGSVAPAGGNLVVNAGTLDLGANSFRVDQYALVTLQASSDIVLGNGTGGLAASNDLTLSSPLIVAAPVVPLTPFQEQEGQAAAAPANQIITAGGALVITNPGGSAPAVTAGLGASLTLVGAGISDAGSIVLPSGSVTLHATAGDVTVSSAGALDLSGQGQSIYNLTKYTNGGQITLTSDAGNVVLDAGVTVNVSAQPGGGNAGVVAVNATQGIFSFTGATIRGQGGGDGASGRFSLDVGSLPTFDALDPELNAGGFALSRSIRVRSGDVAVNDTATAQSFTLSADGGSITLNGEINASGATGGMIDLEASGSVILAAHSLLTVEGRTFDAAGKGGAISLEAGSEINGTASTEAFVNIEANSTINLSVDAATAASSALGDLTGTLHIRAPEFADGSGLQVDPIQGAIVGASSIAVEGYKIYIPAGGSIGSVEGSAATSTVNDGTVYGDAEGFANNTTAILSGLLTNTSNAVQASLFQIIPGAEIINNNVDTTANPAAGDLTLAANWDLSSFRFGPNHVPGDLTLRAGGNLVFDMAASLSDGFTINPSDTADGLWAATLMATPSWSYRLVAGADFGAADYRQVLPENRLQSVDADNNPVVNAQDDPVFNGSVLLGEGSAPLQVGSTAGIITQNYQTIRTGTGNIEIYAGGDVQLLNNLSTIYTAGVAVSDPTLGGTFEVPVFRYPSTTLGSYSPPYPAQYSDAGGNVTISAQNNIGHYNADGTLDSSLELPTNWLFRQGAVGANGLFATTQGTAIVQSTSWWTDFNNFFESVGALGGGNVTLTAGHDVNNVDAVVPTNARMPGVDVLGNAIAPKAGSLVELGGGDLAVHAGDNINGGVYYVERGQGDLSAGNEILTNSARAAVQPGPLFGPADPQSYLPTTLFLGGADGGTGSAGFMISAGGNLLLGPVANPFLLPQSINNTYQEKTYFSTYAPGDAVDVASLNGTVTLQDSSDSGNGSLSAWYNNVLLSSRGSFTDAANEPWLGIIENTNGVTLFNSVTGLMAPTLQVTAFGGDIDIRGSLTLAPSPIGTVNLAAAGSVNGFQPNGLDSSFNEDWGSTTINLSDANPAAIPGLASPAAPPSNSILFSNVSTAPILNGITALFAESGATQGVSLQTEETLHAPGPLHANDPTGPLRIYAGNGNISGVTLYAGKATDVVAGLDITDIAFYLQNVAGGDVSLVQSGREIVAYDVNSPLRLQGQTSGNLLLGESEQTPEGYGTGAPNAGDIQIAGPGTLEVLAGRNLTLGTGPTNSNGTAVGISSIGGTVNPSLPFAGADIVAASGLGAGAGPGLDGNSRLQFTNANGTGFTDLFLNPAGAESSLYLPDLGLLMGLPSSDTDGQIWTAFSRLPVKAQDVLALDIFYLVLRDAGRDHNDSSSAHAGTYAEGDAALAALFPAHAGSGDISLTSREIKTTNGGNIDLLAPGGSVDVGMNVPGVQPVDQGILTVNGGNISIFVNDNVNVGTSRIFTLHGGNEIIWASTGNIDAGASSKTVQSAPPTRVLVYPTSGDVETDLAGLATGGGIGVLETVVGAAPGDVDLIAPRGTVNAGDAGIRASGNLTIAAVQVLNAGNISVGGKSSGVPTGASAPNIGALSAGNASAGAAANAATSVAQQGRGEALPPPADLPSIITVEVIGYGGGDE